MNSFISIRIFWILSLLVIIACQTFLPDSEYNALFRLYQTTHGQNWFWNSNYEQYGYPWNFTAVDSDPCSSIHPWQGLYCSPCNATYCHVVDLNLNSFHLVGKIPPDIGNLPYLTTLNFGGNRLNGTFPVSITLLSQLKTLALNNNDLTGTIPQEISLLSQLTYLSLAYNDFYGDFPSSICSLSQLISLEMHNNYFFGTLPSSLANLTLLQDFAIYYNEFTGTIPIELFSLQNLLYFYAQSNSLTGTIPDTIQQLSQLQYFYVDSNLLTGTIPQNISLPNLLQFSINTNYISGSIPNSFYESSNLQILYLYGNQLTGQISSEITQLTNLHELAFYYNYITGPFPITLGLLTNLIFIYCFHNLMSGPIPYSIGNIKHMEYFDAYENLYTSTIPSSIGLLTNIALLDVNSNFITGTIPPEITNCIYLMDLSLYSNYFTGTLPEQIFTFSSSMTSLMLFNNLFTGTLPSTTINSTQIISLDFEVNFFSGTIPDAFNTLKDCMYLYLSSNRFTGTLSEQLFVSKALAEFAIYENLLTGSLAQGYVYNSSTNVLSVLDVSNNQMSGNIPRSIQVAPYLVYFSVGSNYMTGNIPDNILYQPGLSYFELSDNFFTSTLPSKALHTNDRYKYLDFSNNLLTGQYPYDVYQNYFKLLSYLSLANNFFTGPFPFNIGGSNVKVLYLQNNSFTGSISNEMASGKNLNIFMASLNCLTGTIPESFCSNSNLSQLILDGLHSSQGCITRLFDFDQDSSYGVFNGVHNTIPSCLFDIPTLKVLHLSGNNLHGTLPFEIFQYSNQTNIHSLILANNLLTGTIPSSLWTDNMVYLDLSFNRFIDSHLGNNEVTFLSHGFPYSISNLTIFLQPTIRLQVNHLSGKVPSTFVQNISSEIATNILEGNMYVCNEQRDDLPSNDPNFNTYQCGSDYTNTSLFVALGFFIIFTLMLIYFHGYQYSERIFQYIFQLGQTNEMLLTQINQTLQLSFFQLFQLSKTLKFLGRILCMLLIWILLCLMPTYIGLSNVYGTYIHQYVWVVSSAYISGTIPAVVLLCLFIVIVVILNYFFLFSPNALPINQFLSYYWIHINKNYNNWQCWQTNHWWYWIKFFLFICFETGVVLIVNFSYVLALNHGYNNVTITWISLAVSAFKLLWGNVMLLGFGRKCIEQYFQIQLHTEMIILMSIFNNVIAPYLAEALVSSNCFYYAITSSPAVNTLYYDLKCFPSYQCETNYETLTHTYETICNFEINCDDLLQLVENNMNYLDIQYHLSSSVYQPPFHYNYTCSSSLLSAFVYVFVYRYVFTGIVEPILFFLLKWIQINTQLIFQSTYLHCGFIQNIDTIFSFTTEYLPIFMKFHDFSESNDYTLRTLQSMNDSLEFKINPAEKSIVRLITDITVMLSFGVLFPPLSILIFLSLMKDMIREQYYLATLYQSFLNNSNKNNNIDVTSNDKCNNQHIPEEKDIPSISKDNNVSKNQQIFQTIQELLIKLDSMFEIWNIHLWTGWWWSGVVSVWFWSFSLFDMLAIESGPIIAIWIVLVMGLSPYWIRGLWNLGFYGVNSILLQIQKQNNNLDIHSEAQVHSDETKYRINNIFVDKSERATELTIPRESLQSISSSKASFSNGSNNNIDGNNSFVVDNPLVPDHFV